MTNVIEINQIPSDLCKSFGAAKLMVSFDKGAVPPFTVGLLKE